MRRFSFVLKTSRLSQQCANEFHLANMSEPVDLRCNTNFNKKRKFKSYSVEVTSEIIENETELQCKKTKRISRVKKCTCKRLSYKDKQKIVNESYVLGINSTSINYQISINTLKKWRMKKCKVDENYEKFGDSKNIINPKVAERDNEVYLWLVNALKNGTPVTGATLQQKALEVNKKIDVLESFSASDGWLYKFKQRYKIRSLKITCT